MECLSAVAERGERVRAFLPVSASLLCDMPLMYCSISLTLVGSFVIYLSSCTHTCSQRFVVSGGRDSAFLGAMAMRR